MLKEYKCLNCDGGISFDPASQQLQCPFCDSTFEVAAVLEMEADCQSEQEDITWTPQHEDRAWEEGEEESMHIYSCNSCGGEIVAEASTAATQCPFCGNPVVMKGNLTGSLKPDLIIPFKLDKAQAKEALQRHLSGKRLLPKCFKSKKTLDEITSVYVPFWLFDADVDANMRYRATTTRMWSDSRFNYIETRHFNIIRQGDIAFDGVPVDASTKMPSDMMESLEPFDVSTAMPFSTSYLAGHMADKFDYDSAECAGRANARIKNTTELTFRRSVVGYTTVMAQHQGVAVKGGKVQYALLPVWTIKATYKDKPYMFAMNGQTGKFVGDLPMDWGIFWKWFSILTVGLTAVISLIAILVGGFIQ
ncbi:MAG: hypothetical protein FWC69_05755 [Defluviitaleaceae bacterium]|nr:hypothetical protein [Defluviitaleaceae bacterium]